MKCIECGNGLPARSRFCLSCGKEQPQQSDARRKDEVLMVRVIVLGLVLIALCGTVWKVAGDLRATSEAHASPPASNPVPVPVSVAVPAPVSVPVPAPVPVPVRPAEDPQFEERINIVRGKTVSLLSTVATVPPRNFASYWFDIPEGYGASARIHGNFSAQGGSGNDITVTITNQEGLTNLRNGHQYRIWYDSGKVTVGSFDVRIAPGRYYLVFNNRESVFSNKAVTFALNLSP